jgi:chromosome segregation ATPase
MERRVLIVESQNDFALTMATVLKNSGFQTSLAASAADAQRELEKRRPDLVVLRAELPDQSGFVLCGTIRKGKFGQNLPVILLSSDVGPEALHQHSQSPNAANAYLPIPFEMGELSRLSTTIVPSGSTPSTTADDMDADLDQALTGGPPTGTNMPAVAPPPLRTGGPPRLPRRERRSALTDEDKTFLDRAFQSIADRKAELLAESREVRRPASRREMGTPEAKIQILRDELKSREAQIARISEIWSVRERELLSVEDRLNEKDVEIQGLKMQQDDLTRRLSDSQNTLVEKEREHGRQVEDLLLQKFIGEKEVIEVVSAKEKEINGLRREKSNLEEDIARRAAELDQAKKEFEQLEKEYQLATLEFEVKEKQAFDTVQLREAELTGLKATLDALQAQHDQTVSERDTKYAEFEGQHRALTEVLETTENERSATIRELESKLRLSEEHAQRSDTEGERLQVELGEAKSRAAIKIGDLEGEIATLNTQLEALASAKAESEAALGEQLTTRNERISALETDLADTVEQKDRQEADLQSEIQQKLERIGELEGEVEAIKAALADREAELTAELGELGAANNEQASTIAAQSGAIAELEQSLAQRVAQVESLTDEVAERDGKIADLEARVSSALQTIADRDGEVAALKEAIEARQQEIAALEASVVERDETITGLNVSLDETQKALLATQSALNESQASLEARMAELAQTVEALERTQAELNKVRQERDERQGEVTQARNEIQRVAGLLRQSEQNKAQLEETLSGEIGQLKTSLSEAQGNYEAEAAAHEQLQLESSTTITTLTGERDGLHQRLETTQVDLAATRANLDETAKTLDIEKRSHADSTAHFEARVETLDGELTQVREQAQDLAEQLDATRQELGARVAELTQLNARFAHAEDTRSHLEERMATLQDESQRREELLQNDLATKSKELADTLRKLTQLQQEKVRQVDQLTREVTTKTELAKQLEVKLKSLFDESKKKTDELGGRVNALSSDLESTKKDLAEKTDAATRAGEAQQTALHERDQVRAQLQSSVQQANARIQEANAAIAHEKANAKKTVEEVTQRVQRAEARIAQVQQEGASKQAEAETRFKEAQAELTRRQRRIAELEQAAEGASAVKVRAEKELQAKILAAEQKTNDTATRYATALQERKALEARHQKDLDDLATKQKAEIERRDQVKAQEVKRLQDAVQEKSKQLKVVELELARYKNKPAGVTSSPSRIPSTTVPSAPPMRAAAPPPVGGDDEEGETTGINPMPAAAPRAAPPAAPRAAAPTRPPVSVTAPLPQKVPPPRDERTVVMTPAQAAAAQGAPKPAADEEADFTSIIDGLGD